MDAKELKEYENRYNKLCGMINAYQELCDVDFIYIKNTVFGKLTRRNTAELAAYLFDESCSCEGDERVECSKCKHSCEYGIECDNCEKINHSEFCCWRMYEEADEAIEIFDAVKKNTLNALGYDCVSSLKGINIEIFITVIKEVFDETWRLVKNLYDGILSDYEEILDIQNDAVAAGDIDLDVENQEDLDVIELA